jgi:cytochrome c
MRRPASSGFVAELAFPLLGFIAVDSAMIRVLTMVSVIFISITAGCARRDADAVARNTTGGDPANGRRLVYQYGCGSCHTIPGVGEADGSIGPPLRGFWNRMYIAGLLQNTPENLSRWIARPQEVQPGNAMPDIGVTEGQARDIAAYLYTLR